VLHDGIDENLPMSIDDRYRARLQTAIAALRYWCPSIADSANISETDAGEYWELEIVPHVKGACPFELVLRADGYHDMVIAGETYEDEATDNLDLFVPLAAAIARGDVVQRSHISAATGLTLAIETVVDMGNAGKWQRRRDVKTGLGGGALSDVLVRQRAFLPYQRS